MFGSNAASPCRALSSSVELLLYSVASVLMLSLCCESLRGYGERAEVEKELLCGSEDGVLRWWCRVLL